MDGWNDEGLTIIDAPFCGIGSVGGSDSVDGSGSVGGSAGANVVGVGGSGGRVKEVPKGAKVLSKSNAACCC